MFYFKVENYHCLSNYFKKTVLNTSVVKKLDCFNFYTGKCLLQCHTCIDCVKLCKGKGLSHNEFFMLDYRFSLSIFIIL